MMAYGRLRQTQWLGQVTDACLTVGLRGDEAEEAEAMRVSECSEDTRERLGATLAQWCVQDRGATGNDFAHWQGILTYFDGGRNGKARGADAGTEGRRRFEESEY
jgi:hypothetical protein